MLDRQDRDLWNREAIVEGQALLDKALRHARPGPYQIQAAIAALHCEAAHATQTDWAQIALLYESLERIQPSPVVTVNRAVAIAKALDAERGLKVLESVAGQREIQAYAEFHGVRAHLLERLGRKPEAAAAYQRARELTHNAPTVKHLDERILSVVVTSSG